MDNIAFNRPGDPKKGVHLDFKKIEITENSLDQLKTSIQNITNSDKSKEGWIVFDNFIFGRNLTLVFEFNISS